MQKLIYLSGLILLLFATNASAQILDDSTKNVYGPETTLFFYESQIKYNQGTPSTIDTSLFNLQRFDYVQRNDNLMQNLGNMGTAIRPIFYGIPTTVGRQSGMRSFSPYFRSPETIQYYDTKSPFSRLNYVIGGGGRTLVDIDFARNVNPNWNVGFNFTRVISDKHLNPARRRGDRNAESFNYHFHTNYSSENQKYRLLAHFSRNAHDAVENGGILPEGDFAAFFDDNDRNVALNGNPISGELRTNYHIFHQYEVSKLLQVYHSMDRTKQSNYFRANNILQDTAFFTQRNTTNEAVVDDLGQFRTFQNEAGVKGDVGELFYNFYLKRRDLSFSSSYKNSIMQSAENAGGAVVRYDFSEITNVGFDAEYTIGNFYRLGASVNHKYLEASYKRARVAPDFFFLNYGGTFHDWRRNFNTTAMDELRGQLNLQYKNIVFQPALSLSNIDRHIYLQQDPSAKETVQPISPRQTGSSVQLISPEINLNFSFLRNMHVDTKVIYTLRTGAESDVFQIPDLIGNFQMYYSNFLFNNKLRASIGFDVHYRSAYYAYDYAPAIQSFFLQDNFEVPDALIADFFVNFKISRVRVFMKMTHLNQGFPDPGYFFTPYYPGVPMTFDLGLNWLFFD